MIKYTYLFLLFSAFVNAEQKTAPFMLKPDQCVALEQGQSCFIDIEVQWQTELKGDFCLFVDDVKAQCWQSTQAGLWKNELEMKTDVAVSLKDSNHQMIYSGKVKYAWIYKKRKNKAVRWRMF
ncbi:hypothetical protein A7985_12980 [Pseudoalteromonas luteoviolacea]|uniref:DUF3019 domain-containing protein n=1 Tax=Pseudoalteromonas luteoviolacea TaxID=43657 RepID=A0A1C0TRD2_9GAMM|nr:DUF3019 domain-containing protein [Pseudoalteromonas luteoviolacea]MBQ4813237.1 DUF3019 domain-containing protein [Pseudoalteromonas luteoviolacea]OCQ21509.1 hypothetical protein A7985_12980 [Pseudoalteromonas luteoviolacea]